MTAFAFLDLLTGSWLGWLIRFLVIIFIFTFADTCLFVLHKLRALPDNSTACTMKVIDPLTSGVGPLTDSCPSFR